MSLNLAVLLTESAVRQPGRTVLVMDRERLSYGELHAAANKVANALHSLGVRRGEKVAMIVPNVPQFAIIYYGILKLGATVVPLPAHCEADDIHYYLRDSDAAAIFAWEGCAERACAGFRSAATCRHLIIVNAPGSDALPNGAISYSAMLAIGSSSFEMAATMPDDTAVIAYTTDPAGREVGVELTHFNLFYNAVILVDRLLGLNAETVGLAALPLSGVFGQTCILNALVYAGGAISLLPSFDTSATLDAIARDRVTYIASAPAILRDVLLPAGATTTLNVCIAGGAVGPGEGNGLLTQIEVPVLMAYGRVETSPIAAINPRHAPRRGSIGLPIWGTDIRLVNPDGEAVAPGDTGEIIVRGHNVMKGYYRQAEATAAVLRDGWLHTGDMARQDEDGYLYLVESGPNVADRAAQALRRNRQER